ncbi:hypothetical protein J4464_07065 [Candidatus Woesearchaeota archaeon]|nr:hypothetical protein [Candidatus Woesearchaeota archaeon]
MRITCPDCKHTQDIKAPDRGVLPFYSCRGCGMIIPCPRDAHCVICAYADQPCKSVKK